MRNFELEVNFLDSYLQREHFRGYDPYDILNSWFPFSWFGKWGQAIAIQIGKRNPINLRYILGIKKEYNPKGLGLLLKAYCLLYEKTSDDKYLDTAESLFKKIIELRSPGRKYYCWGYNFVWANPQRVLPKYYPSVVVSSFVGQGIYEYYRITHKDEAKEVIYSIGHYILEELPRTETNDGLCFSYTDYRKDCCYNATMLAAEMLAIIYSLNKDESVKDTVLQTINYVISHQHPDGMWNYSIEEISGKERHQIDFHQGFILVSLFHAATYCDLMSDTRVIDAIKKGLDYYKGKQFFPDGRSLWRVPQEYPVEIHNQAQGIITFSVLKSFSKTNIDFARMIANWTISNMYDPAGFFYYMKYEHSMIKTPYMRWSQCWMFLALTYLEINDE